MLGLTDVCPQNLPLGHLLLCVTFDRVSVSVYSTGVFIWQRELRRVGVVRADLSEVQRAGQDFVFPVSLDESVTCLPKTDVQLALGAGGCYGAEDRTLEFTDSIPTSLPLTLTAICRGFSKYLLTHLHVTFIVTPGLYCIFFPGCDSYKCKI